MKSFKDFTNKELEEDVDGMPGVFTSKPAEPPQILILRRKSIRQFPNGQRVALYQIDKLNKYVTIPYMEKNWTAEETELQLEPIEESVIHHLQNIVDNHAAKSIKFKDGSSMKVDTQTANAILKVHGAVNDENKKKISDMAHKSKTHFKKVADFAWKHVTYKTKD
ncbi:MAG: hypothetical protein EBU90_15985 [Proteobacteria bacterium]|nr:hypothetical protein [Pseudomonadota bacterium]